MEHRCSFRESRTKRWELSILSCGNFLCEAGEISNRNVNVSLRLQDWPETPGLIKTLCLKKTISIKGRYETGKGLHPSIHPSSKMLIPLVAIGSCLSVHPSHQRSNQPMQSSVYSSICPFTLPCIHPFIHPTIHPLFHLSIIIFLSDCASICPFVVSSIKLLLPQTNF